MSHDLRYLYPFYSLACPSQWSFILTPITLIVLSLVHLSPIPLVTSGNHLFPNSWQEGWSCWGSLFFLQFCRVHFGKRNRSCLCSSLSILLGLPRGFLCINSLPFLSEVYYHSWENNGSLCKLAAICSYFFFALQLTCCTGDVLLSQEPYPLRSPDIPQKD